MISRVAGRTAAVSRRTGETSIELRLGLDGPPGASAASGNGFLDHLITALAKHGGLELELRATSDCAVAGTHHLAEDTGVALGEALRFAVYGTSAVPVGQAAPAVARFGQATRPMDEALASSAVDLCGRAGAYLRGMPAGAVGNGLFLGSDWAAFCQGLAQGGMLTLHLALQAGEDPHHMLEASAKALGAAIGAATRDSGADQAGTSTKGSVTLAVAPWQRP